MTTQYSELSKDLYAYLANSEATESEIAPRLIECGLRGLPVFKEHLRKDLPIDQAERLEMLLKLLLRSLLRNQLSGAEARQIASFQMELGFILKYKSYAIKAATPVGYSIFLQNEREGFSFQRHIEHKLEVFHILQVRPGGYVFLCDFEQWAQIYRKETFQNWLAGGENADYDRYKFVPAPGDVFVISELGTVHTVVGCVLEEYATVSTDMVQRLHDQNTGRAIPPSFNRHDAEEALRAIAMPPANRIVSGLEHRHIEPIVPHAIQGGERTILCDSFVRAARYVIAPKQGTSVQREDDRVALLRISSGEGGLVICDSSETWSSIPPVEVSTGDLVLIPPGVPYAITNEADGYLTYSEQCISPTVAFV
jgi:mannose-6-phosphate isomerase-like protein (cupin superfamily)